jgi:hypothetical protein
VNEQTDATDLEWLGEWFEHQCDGDWEHQLGVRIETLDNPGWSFRVDLTGTTLSEEAFASQEVDDGERWMRLWKDDDAAVFHGAGSPTMLPMMIERFSEWTSAAPTRIR